MSFDLPSLAGRSLEDLFAYAHAMEHEASRRYAQLAGMMVQHGNTELAELFRRLEGIERLHVQDVESAARDVDVTISPATAIAGLGLAGAEVMDFEDMHYLQRPRQALELARDFEERAARFYEDLAFRAHSVPIREAALRFAEVERSHVWELDRWLVRYPPIEKGWDEDPDPAGELE